jgi:hypothetical protein
MSEVLSHRELIADIEPIVQTLQFMTFRDLDKLS